MRFRDAGVWACRAVLVAQGLGPAALGLMIAMVACFALLGGATFWFFALSAAAVAFYLIAAGFAVMALKISAHRDRWRLVLAVLQIALVSAGIPMFTYANSYGPDTHGPFADGGNGLTALTALAFVGGAVAVLMVLALDELIARGTERSLTSPEAPA